MTLKATPAVESARGVRIRGCCGADLRCACGSMLARVVEGGVELKCRRCKRTWLIPLEPSQGGHSEG
ncbi:MAG: hypothetical protein HY897_09620 [Deltaproteobacteria bacterium]|nr:hypothetical protein [Deltaproteobacteria bacterium]